MGRGFARVAVFNREVIELISILTSDGDSHKFSFRWFLVLNPALTSGGILFIAANNQSRIGQKGVGRDFQVGWGRLVFEYPPGEIEG